MAFNTFIDNRTPFSADKFVLPDKEGQEVLVLVVSATFEMGGEKGLQIADEQSPVRAADEDRGEPGISSIRYEADIALEKPHVDVLINAQAYAPAGCPAREVPVEIRVADVRKQLMVSGDRFWRALGAAPSSPEPFIVMPIIYERAFGGTDLRHDDPAKQVCDSRNPVGVGFKGAMSRDPDIHTHIPNIEYAGERINSPFDQPKPAALGVVGRGWQPRIGFAGTYDDAWLKAQWPLLPADFDPRHYQAAPADQQSRTLRGGETVDLFNLTPDGRWTFRLPVLNIPLRLYYDDRSTQAALRLDTVLIEADRRRVTLTSRLSVKTIRNRGMLREIVLGHMSRGWLRAREQRKTYRDNATNSGVCSDMPVYSL